MSESPTHYLWVDVETTGLDPTRDPIIEIACILTDVNLTENIHHLSTPINAGPGLIKQRLEANPFVEEMHTKNGLLSCLHTTDGMWPTVDEAEHFIIEMLQDMLLEPGKVMLAGSGVAHFDKRVLEIQMPRLTKWFHYRPMDIGNIRSFVKYTVQRPDLLPPEKESSHRAFDDILQALTEARVLAAHFGVIPIIAIDEEG